MPKLSLLNSVKILNKLILSIFLASMLCGCDQSTSYKNSDGQQAKPSSYQLKVQHQHRYQYQHSTEGEKQVPTAPAAVKENTMGVNIPDLPTNTDDQNKKD